MLTAGAGTRRIVRSASWCSATRSPPASGLRRRTRFPAKLERALKAKGIAVAIANAGVSGDTAAGGLARLDWSVPDGTEAVILELGANDALRGIDPEATREALDRSSGG